MTKVTAAPPPPRPIQRIRSERGDRLRLKGSPSSRIVPSHQMIVRESTMQQTERTR